jgi:two-component system, sporulation sensor kinase E
MHRERELNCRMKRLRMETENTASRDWIDGDFCGKGGRWHGVPIGFYLDMELRQLVAWLEQMPQAVMVVDDRGYVVAVNPVFLHSILRDREEVEGKPFAQFVAIPNEAVEFIHHANDTCVWYRQIHGSVIAKDGSFFPTDVQMVRGWDGQRRYHLLFFNRITRQVEPQLLQRFADHLISDIHLGIVLVDEHGILMEINRAACDLFGVQRDKLIHQPLDKLMAHVLPAQEQHVLENALTGITTRNVATTWKIGDKQVHLLVDAHTLRDEAGHILGAYMVLKDMTNLRLLEEQIKRNDRLATIGQIAAGTAHEIRNPLTSIKGFLQVIKYALKEKGHVKEQGYTEIMLREINRINSLVSEFLLLSKPRNIKLRPLQVTDVWNEMLPIVENEAILHNMKVNFVTERSVFPLIVADGELLKQVFLNLCKNAIEAMGEGGMLTVRIRLEEAEQKLAVDVQDTGPGIPSYALDKIFDPFFTTKENGTGLGLSVCQKIIHEIGGMIRVSSKEWGTVFTVLMPYID